MIGLWDVLRLRSNSRRGRPKHSVPSRPSCHPSPASMPNIRSISTPRSSPFSDNHIFRILSPLRTRSNYFARASPHWRSCSSSPRVMRRKQNFVKDYQCMEAIPIQTGCLHPPRQLKDIEERLGSLHGKSVPLRYLDNVQDNEDVTGLLEDLREAVNDYMVRS